MKHYLAMKSKNRLDPEESDTIWIEVKSERKPKYLSDFSGGEGKLSSGYQATEDSFTIIKKDTKTVILEFSNGSTSQLSLREDTELNVGQRIVFTQEKYQPTLYEITIIS